LVFITENNSMSKGSSKWSNGNCYIHKFWW
jgi:hypothetical protein